MGFREQISKKRIFCLVFVSLVLFWVFSWKPEDGLRLDELFNETTVEFKYKSSNKLFNLDFKYILSSEPCASDTLAVIIVTSHYNNIETRSAMRRSYSQQELKNFKLKRVFLLGEAPNSVYMSQASILHENERFGDLIQGNFREAYRNLTYKHIMGLKWVSENCQSAKYFIKMDDDIVFDVPKTVKLLEKVNLRQNSIMGYVLRDMKPIREPANKWFVTQAEYGFSHYPTFVSGWFYVSNPKLAAKLVVLSHYFKYFWIDDLYVTGILTKHLDIRLIDLRKFVTVHYEFLQCCVADVVRNLECEFLIGPNGGDVNFFFEFNEAMKICQDDCDKRDKSMNQTCVAERKINLKGGSSIIQNYKLH